MEKNLVPRTMGLSEVTDKMELKEMRYEINLSDGLNVYLDEHSIDVIMAFALDGISNTWATKIEPMEEYDPDEYEYMSDMFSQGCAFIIYPRCRSGKEVGLRLTISKFLNGVTMWLKDFVSDEYNKDDIYLYLDKDNTFVGEEINAYEADKMIQYALFGKILVR